MRMPTGTVKWFDVTKGYGFITPDDGGQDVFLHIAKVQVSKLPTLDTGLRLQYAVATKNGKSFAHDLSVIAIKETPPRDQDADDAFEREWGLRRQCS